MLTTHLPLMGHQYLCYAINHLQDDQTFHLGPVGSAVAEHNFNQDPWYPLFHNPHIFIIAWAHRSPNPQFAFYTLLFLFRVIRGSVF